MEREKWEGRRGKGRKREEGRGREGYPQNENPGYSLRYSLRPNTNRRYIGTKGFVVIIETSTVIRLCSGHKAVRFSKVIDWFLCWCQLYIMFDENIPKTV